MLLLPEVMVMGFLLFSRPGANKRTVRQAKGWGMVLFRQDSLRCVIAAGAMAAAAICGPLAAADAVFMALYRAGTAVSAFAAGAAAVTSIG
jgi:hypothetical protein